MCIGMDVLSSQFHAWMYTVVPTAYGLTPKSINRMCICTVHCKCIHILSPNVNSWIIIFLSTDFRMIIVPFTFNAYNN